VQAHYAHAERVRVLDVYIRRRQALPAYIRVAFDTGSHAFETATLDGNAAVLWYDPTGRDQGETMVSVFDEARGIEYITVSAHSSIDLAPTVAIARNLYR
jgi:hypothetical protein